ncbi:outer membrane beta-barrel protein [Candidatus Endomicrobiellum devescovinae]|jgi:hypothetical protein|uniref:outer membrane beta-barrel protein n=1 Tax=Candidatus Endomicrobiellum devescovinae TaxID=3242322 RepID=UPI00283A5CA3|nr:outer membrane beta-barrel protein [Endomicrobium sp.]
MKRIRAVLLVIVGLLVGRAMSVALASDNFGELNIKAGLNLTSLKRMDLLRSQKFDAEKLNPSGSLCGEYLISGERLVSNLNFLKIGLGLKYLFPSEFKIKNTSIPDFKLSFLPIYFTLQANPFIKSNNEGLKGMFVKGDIGYNAYFSQNVKEIGNNDGNIVQFKKSKGGLYYAFGAGYEFPSGLVFDITYSIL